MYAYYLAAALRLEPPLWWKRQITALQIFQFSVGVCGASYFWAHYFAPPLAWAGLGAWPPLQFVPGCAGGDARVLFVGDCMNVALLSLFAQFYWRSYVRGAPKKRE
jgi:hypothetical protein